MGDGFRYLGFRSKPNNYRIVDWQWLLEKFHNKLYNWAHRWLTLGGKYIMAQAVLQQLMVYWAHIYILPSHLVHKIKILMAHFIWGGLDSRHRYHLMKWENITVPKEFGEWGILDIKYFGWALIIKSTWRALYQEGIKSGSCIWNNFLKIKDWFHWKIGLSTWEI